MIARSRLIFATTISLILTSVGSSVLANPNSEQDKNNSSDPATVLTYENVADLFEEALYYESGDFLTFSTRPFAETMQLVFGVSSPKSNGQPTFPEKEIIRDTILLDTLYKDYLRQQAGDQAIRTQDLDNPYNTSLRSLDN